MQDATTIIRESLAKLSKSDSPETLRTRIAGEIDMAYKLGLIEYPERDRFVCELLDAATARQEQISRARNERAYTGLRPFSWRMK